MTDISGNIKEDEQEAFNLVCKRVGLTPEDAKGVGFLNRLIKLSSIAKLTFKLDYSQEGNGRFTVGNVPNDNNGAIEEPKAIKEEPVKEVIHGDLNTSDADTDDDPFAMPN